MWRGTQEDEDGVRRRLQEERQMWLEEQHAAGSAAPPRLKFLSVGKLLRVIAASRTVADPCEALAQWGIVRHQVGEHDQRLPKQRKTAPGPVTYTSSHAWITGFLCFQNEAETSAALHLCDVNSAVPSVLLDPLPQCVDQLVLLKRWVLVDKAMGSERPLTAALLEIHEKPVLLQWSPTGQGVSCTQQDALKVLKASYPVQDPPLFSGRQSWAEAVHALYSNQVNEGSSGAVATAEPVLKNQKSTQKKRKRTHAVFGRVTSVSPISWQQVRASCHFFLEVERHDRSNHQAQQSVVNVMFTGAASLRWHLFLRPGKLVLLSDLNKVFSRECKLFLLQTMAGGPAKSTEDSTQLAPETCVMIWEPEAPLLRPIRTPVQGNVAGSYFKEVASSCCGKLVDYEGRVMKLLWDECVELRGDDGASVLVCLFRFPYANDLARLRKGATLQVRLAHILRWPTPVGGKLVLGLCPRSHLTITEHAKASSPCIAVEPRPSKRRSGRKWSQLGDFHRQPMTLSMWLLEMLELLSKKFYFGSDVAMQDGPPLLAFQQVGRREAMTRVAKHLGVDLRDRQRLAAVTLGALFLNCHAANATNCTTIQLQRSEQLLTFTRVLTVQELQTLGERMIDQVADQGQPSGSVEEGGPRSVKLSGNDLAWCLLVGSFRGNIDSGDLEICDRTGSIPLHLSGGSDKGKLVDLHGGQGVYLLRGFELMVEDFNKSHELEIDERVPLMHRINCPRRNVEFVSMSSDEETSDSAKETSAENTQYGQELAVLVTHVDSLPQSKLRSAGFLPEYRLVHGVVLPIGAQLPMANFVKGSYCVDLLVPTDCTNWHVRKFGCYRITAVQVESKATATECRLARSIEEKAIAVWGSFCRSWKVNTLENGVCLHRTAQQLASYEAGEAQEAAVDPVRLYQLKTGPCSITPIELKCSASVGLPCQQHELCQRSSSFDSSMVVFPLDSEVTSGGHANFNFETPCTPVQPISIDVPAQELVAVSLLKRFAQQSESLVSVGSLLCHQLCKRSPSSNETSRSNKDPFIEATVDPMLHKAHLVSLTGVITSKKFFWRRSAQQDQFPSTQEVLPGAKRAREFVSGNMSASSDPTRRLMCKFQVRGLGSVDTIDIQVDVSRFGLHGALQVNSVVEFTRLQGFVARSSYKVYLDWSNGTAARLVQRSSREAPPSSAELYGSMATTFLNDVYRSRDIDRRLHRYVVRVVHVNYVLLKRKCAACHRALKLDRRRSCWNHAVTAATGSVKPTRECAWRQQLRPADAIFTKRSYMNTSMRCIIDDGSAQAELFLENDVAWDVLPCTRGQRRRFEDILSLHAEELTYFSGHASGGFFSSTNAEYYENELRALVVTAVPALRSLAVYARRFYSASASNGGRGGRPKGNTAVLTFGKDIQLTTSTQPHAKLEALRVDQLHVRSELQRRLAQLRARQHA